MMNTKLALLGIATSLLLVAGSSRADEEAIRIETVGVTGFDVFHRTASEPKGVDGFSLGGEVRVHPYSRHGFYAAYSHAGAVFGPDLDLVDSGYSFRVFGAAPLRGLTPALYLDLGPSLAFVDLGTTRHTDLGARVAATFDLHIWNFAVGAQGSYRAGVPVTGRGDPVENVAQLGLRLGGAFDVAKLTLPRTETAKR